MAVPRSPDRWVFILLVVGLVGIGVAVALLVPARVLGAEEPPRPVTATVVESGSCGQGMDTVEWDADGQKKQAKLDGCGHRKGETVDIINTGGEMVSSAASLPVGLPVGRRLTALLLCMAALAGGFYAFLFRYAPLRAPAVMPSPRQESVS
ncbi:hypothetical protein SK854_38760 [Lentzea sp. BCCO 10_0061]|uniref:Uncharacterized protein n=1 Tax=Lentzea sokolovensis TaxID=3095429 RepID=A0ABU4V8I0_9PSEU|nr:hypothetical protein [Lentzea sp. BCCO 10_0061]MDX8148107.1 hypothetical protein [Lentzea sp. BCCO 10_0061]